MNDRPSTSTAASLPAKVFAAVGLTATVIAAIGAITLRFVDPVPVVRSTFGFTDLALVGFEMMGVAFASVGALLVIRRPRNAIGWCMVLTGVGYSIGAYAAAVTYLIVAQGTVEALQTARLTGWLTAAFTTLGGVVFLLAFIFPSGRGHTPGWDRFVRLCLILWPAVFLMVVIQPGPLNVFPTIENPFGVGPDLRPLIGIQYSSMVAAGSIAMVPLVAWSLVSRYRLGDTTERQQLKWFAFAVTGCVAGLAIAGFGAFLSDEPPEVGLAIFGYAGALVAVAIGIAILRYRLYEIDRIVSRSISYALVTALLLGVFGGLILILQSLVSGVVTSRGSALDPWVVAASTLVVAALFNPVRLRVQSVVDRRFHRARYDGERTVAGFAGRMRDELDLTTLTGELRRTTTHAVEPTTTGVWLRSTGRA
jgi:hypothetical protein